MTEAELVERLARGSAEQKLDALRALDRRERLGMATLAALARALGDGDKVQLTEPDFTPWSGGGWEAVEYDRVDALAQRVLGQHSVAALPALTDVLAVSGCARRAAELIALLPAADLATVERSEIERALAALASVSDERARMTERAGETLAWVLQGAGDGVKRLLEHPSDAERERALDLVRELSEPARTEAHVAAILSEGDFPKSRYWALERLLTMEPDRDALAPLVRQLASQRLRPLWPRLFALVAKSRLHDAMPTLYRFLSGDIAGPRNAKKHKELLTSASHALGSLSKDDDRADEALIALYLDPPRRKSPRRPELRALVVIALGGPVRAGERLVEPLIEVLGRQDASRVEDAAKALGPLRHGAPSAGPALAEAFERMTARVAANPILERLGPSPPLRAAGALAGVIARRGSVPSSMLPGLVLLLDHRLVRASALAALGRLDGPAEDLRTAEEAIERLLPGLQERRESGDRRRANEALRALRAGRDG